MCFSNNISCMLYVLLSWVDHNTVKVRAKFEHLKCWLGTSEQWLYRNYTDAERKIKIIKSLVLHMSTRPEITSAIIGPVKAGTQK